jgi:hypothetical protein
MYSFALDVFCCMVVLYNEAFCAHQKSCRTQLHQHTPHPLVGGGSFQGSTLLSYN